jgi:hypothetical protein
VSFFQKQAYCRTCERKTLHVMANPEQNKSLIGGMALLTVLTCGLAFPFALAWSAMHGWQIGSQAYHCQVCGRRLGASSSGLAVAGLLVLAVIAVGIAFVPAERTHVIAPSGASVNQQHQGSVTGEGDAILVRSTEPPIEVATPEESRPALASDVSAVAASPPQPTAELPVGKKWSSADGKFSTEAEFMSAGGGKVKLRKRDGSEISVAIDRLSVEDQRWIQDRGRGAK